MRRKKGAESQSVVVESSDSIKDSRPSLLLTFLSTVMWVFALWAVSYKYLKTVDAGHSFGTMSLVWLIVALFLLAAFGAVVLGRNGYSKLRSTAIPKAGEIQSGRKVAVIVVHGMGVHQRYQMLTEFATGIQTYAKRYKVFPSRLTTSRELLVQHRDTDESEDCNTVEIHEIYWGNIFNGATTWRSAIWFGIRTFTTYLRTIFSRFSRKRRSETIWIAAALGVIGFLLFGLYGGFRLSSVRLEYWLHAQEDKDFARFANENRSSPYTFFIFREPKKVADPKIRNLTFVDANVPLDVRISSTLQFVKESYTTLWTDICDSENGPLRLSPFKANPKLGMEMDIAVTALPKLPDYEGYQVLKGKPAPMTFGFLKPLEALNKLPFGLKFVTVIYGIAFVTMILQALRMLAASLGLLRGIFADRSDPDSEYRAHFIYERWRNSARQIFLPGVLGYLFYLLLDPVMVLISVEILICAGILLGIIKFTQWWFENFFGDVQIYATYDENAKSCLAREAATNMVKENILNIAEREAKLGKKVFVVAHSLGSVITLNALRRLAGYTDDGADNTRPLTDIAGYITLGSPLRKFRQLFNARRFKWGLGQYRDSDKELFLGGTSDSRKIPWFNFWYWSDIFADQLAYTQPKGFELMPDGLKESVYEDVDKTGFPVGERRDLGLRRGGLWTHSDYWLDDRVVDRMLDIWLAEDPSKVDISKDKRRP